MLWTAFEWRKEPTLESRFRTFWCQFSLLVVWCLVNSQTNSNVSSSENRWLQLTVIHHVVTKKWNILKISEKRFTFLAIFFHFLEKKSEFFFKNFQNFHFFVFLKKVSFFSKKFKINCLNYEVTWGSKYLSYHPHRSEIFPLLGSYNPTTHILVLMRQ